MGRQEVNLASRREMCFLLAGIQALGQKQAVSVVCCAPSAQRKGSFHVLPGSQEDRGMQTYSRSPLPESPHFLQEIPHVNYEIVTGACAARRLVHHHRPERRVLSCRNCSRAQKVSAFCLPGDSPVSYTHLTLPTIYSV